MLEKLQKELKYIFKNENLLKNALVHKSYSNERVGVESNERLEFLGDAILEFCISDYLYSHEKFLSEGEMTKKRARIVCTKSLYTIAKQYNLGEYISLGQCEEKTGGRNKEAIIADVVEAIIGAIYLDSDIIIVKKAINHIFKDIIKKSDEMLLDYKTILQEELQKNGTVNISYEILKEEGPDHDKTYEIIVKLDDKILGSGIGKNKKEAEQNAAKKALGAD